jgi:glutamate dehydrogenase (NADP+)/cyclic pyranopterin phosphate synthase/molybdopterin-guanine dinucleotide biosynthesis protein A
MDSRNREVDNVGTLPELPLFEVSGATGEYREQWVHRLMGELERRSLTGTFLKGQGRRLPDRYAALSLAKRYDLVLIDAGGDSPVEQLRITRYGKTEQDSLVWRGGDDSAMEQWIDRLAGKMDELVSRTPVWGCILIGGKSSRMGRPKHLIADRNNITWLEKTTAVLRPLVDGLVVSGAGVLPEKLQGLVRLADIPGVAGPLAGMLAAGRWQPLVSWLFVACDMPYITTEAIHWLLSGRRAGCWGRVPRLAESQHCEPLFAWYDFRAAHLFETQLHDGNPRIGEVACHSKIDKPVIPESLRHGWQNINTPDQLKTAPR